MVIEKLELLEKKILEIINLIANLKSENANLKTKDNKLKEDIKKKEIEMKKIIEENEYLKNIQNDCKVFKDKQDLIKIKVENLIKEIEKEECVL